MRGNLLSSKTCYVAGPMRGHPRFNFPAFDAAAQALRAKEWEVISPAEMDREHGFDGSREPTAQELVEMFERDFDAIARVPYIVLLPGWRMSEGTTAELVHASRQTPRPDVFTYSPDTDSLVLLSWLGDLKEYVK